MSEQRIFLSPGTMEAIADALLLSTSRRTSRTIMSDPGRTLCSEGHVREEDGDECARCQATRTEQEAERRDYVHEAHLILLKQTMLLPQREHLDAVADVLRLILPLAKGYAASHPVGSNQDYITVAETLLAQREASHADS